jgi:hypothetical protein
MKTISTLFAVIILTIASQAQQWSEITMRGRLTEINLSDSSEHILNDVAIEIWTDDSLTSVLYSDEKGRYKFSLPFFHSYEIRYGRDPLVQKTVLVDATDFAQSTMERGFKLEIDMALFEQQEGLKMEFLKKEPVAIASYSKQEDTVIWNAEHIERIQEKIRQSALAFESKK